MTVSWNFDTAEGVGSVPIPGGDPLHGGFHTVKYAVDPGVTAVVFVPDYELSTEKAREALPGEVAYRDAVFNVSRVALMAAAMNPRALASGEEPNALLYAATQDRLHQPYRKGLMQPSWGPDSGVPFPWFRRHGVRRRPVRAGAASRRRRGGHR